MKQIEIYQAATLILSLLISIMPLTPICLHSQALKYYCDSLSEPSDDIKSSPVSYNYRNVNIVPMANVGSANVSGTAVNFS